MEQRVGYIIQNTHTGQYIGRVYNETIRQHDFTNSMFRALRFGHLEDAQGWMECRYAPSSKDDYMIVAVEISIEKVV